MNREQALQLIKDTFENPFDKATFNKFIKNLLNFFDEARFIYQGNYIPDAYKQYIKSLERIGKYKNSEKTLDILIITLQKETSLERARTMQRNFVARYLNGSRGGDLKDAALVAFVPPDKKDWRFSLVKMDYTTHQTESGKTKVKEVFTPVRRWSFLVGENEKCHTAKSRLIGILENDEQSPTLDEIEKAFDIETVTREFFIKYRELFIRTKEELDKIIKKDPKIAADFESKNIDTVNFSKKLLGQIVFLYFLQKKGWFGVGRDDDWGSGSKHFLRELFEKKHANYHNFFNDILEPLFYEALSTDHSSYDDYFSKFNCRIPFLNGGLFDPIGGYDWVHTDILLPNELFSNSNPTKEGDTGDGILDIFDRYNFTVKEDEPLEKEVAIDPELLGKAYEKFNAIRPDNFEDYKKALKSGKKGEENKFNKQYGVYYTPREIVHYMCQQSLINYLYTELNPDKTYYQKLGDKNLDLFGNRFKKGQLDLVLEHREKPEIPKKDIETLIIYGERIKENEAWIERNGKETERYTYLLPESIRKNASQIDQALADITVCDPAVGSGAFLVGMMNEIVKTRNVLSDFIKDNQRSPYEFKRHCIEHSLYGVDIDPGAVEIAKLRLWLSLVVDEEDIRNIKPLPNLDYKITCGNSLLGYTFTPKGLQKIEELKKQYFDETNHTKKINIKNQIDSTIGKLFEETKKHIGYQINFDFKINFSEVFSRNGGFDVVIANPPYVSTKGRENIDKKILEKVFNFVDDLYSHFYFKAFEIASNDNGIVCFITSKTFWTIQTKLNLRKLLLKNHIIEIFDSGTPFEAMVDACIVLVQKTKVDKTYNIIFKDGKKEFLNPDIYNIDSKIYLNAPNKIIFIPSNQNMSIYKKYCEIVKYLMDEWWDKISTSKNIRKNQKSLNIYRESLKPGNITLLGLITEGGQGLATANNGKYIGILEGTRYARAIKFSRPNKLFESINKFNIKEFEFIKCKNDAIKFLNNKNEFEIRAIFDQLKEKYGRDIFGQGYLYRIIKKDEIADLQYLSQNEKENGIVGLKTYIPYEKGDKEGNRWYFETPYYIDWSKENVNYLKNNSGKKGIGMPVVRNPQYYFREGFCWSDIHTVLIKARLKTKGIHDVKSMSLFTLIPDKCPEYYLITILNSKFMSEYEFNFVNGTQTFQMNDARQLPVIIPTYEQLIEFKKVFDEACYIQKLRFNEDISKKEADLKLDIIQNKVDQLVYQLYDVSTVYCKNIS